MVSPFGTEMKRSATLAALIATSVLALFMVLGGTIIPRTVFGHHDTYIALLERQEADFARDFPTEENGKIEKIAEELASRREGIKGLSSIIVIFGRSFIGFGIAILICQFLILHSLFITTKSSTDDHTLNQ